MYHITDHSKMIAAVATKAAATLWLLFLPFFFLRAHDLSAGMDASVPERINASQPEIQTYSTWIHFKCGSARFELGLLDNVTAIEDLYALLHKYGPEGKIVSMDVTVYASPEGTAKRNKKLIQDRIKVFRQVYKQWFTDLPFADITIHNGGESWELLKDHFFNAKDGLKQEKRQLITDILLDTGIDNETRKDRLEKKLGKYTYGYLRWVYYRYIRGYQITVQYMAQEPFVEEPAATESVVEEEPVVVVAPVEEEPAVEEQAPVAEETEALNQMMEEATAKPAEDFVRVPLFAVSTNLLSDLAITPNVAIEVPIGQHFSILADYTFPWWLSADNTFAWQMLKGDLEFRIWLGRRDKSNKMDVLRGHFLGLDLTAGYFDIEPSRSGYQGEFQSVGLEYGYGWKLGTHWRMDAFIAAGWMGAHYRHYENNDSNTRLFYKYDGRFTWFGPTKVGVSIKYLFTAKKKRRDAQ